VLTSTITVAIISVKIMVTVTSKQVFTLILLDVIASTITVRAVKQC
jgi:hypothetical protein